MCVASIAPAGLARQARDEGTIGALDQARERSFHCARVCKCGHSARARAQLPRGLRTAQQQFTQDRDLVRGKLERAVFAVAETVLEFGHAAAEAGFFHYEVAPCQSVYDVLYARLIERHERIAIAFLITGVGEGVQRKGILVRCRDLLFDEATDHPCLFTAQLNVHARMIRGSTSRAKSISRARAAASCAALTAMSAETGCPSR